MSGEVAVQLAGVSSASYSIPNLQAGQYLVIALADADGNGSFEDATDYVGSYPSTTAPALVPPPATGIDIQMVTVGELGLVNQQRTLGAAKALLDR